MTFGGLFQSRLLYDSMIIKSDLLPKTFVSTGSRPKQRTIKRHADLVSNFSLPHVLKGFLLPQKRAAEEDFNGGGVC